MSTSKRGRRSITYVPVLGGLVLAWGCGEGDWPVEQLLSHGHEHHAEPDAPAGSGGQATEVDPGPAETESNAALRRELEAKAVLETYCSSCHDAADGIIGDITDIQSMIAKGEMVPTQPEHSLVYLRMLDGSMPPASVEPRQTPEDVQVIYDFIAGLPLL